MYSGNPTFLRADRIYILPHTATTTTTTTITYSVLGAGTISQANARSSITTYLNDETSIHLPREASFFFSNTRVDTLQLLA